MQKFWVLCFFSWPGTIWAQSASTNYMSVDPGSFTQGGYSSLNESQDFIVNTWFSNPNLLSVNYMGGSAMPSGFIFQCLHIDTPSISQTGDTLTSSPADSFQWYLNGLPIIGATTQTHIAVVDGSYGVQVFFNNGCDALSSALSVTGVGIDTGTWYFQSVKIYPNPTADDVTLEIAGQFTGAVQLMLVDMQGRILQESILEGQSTYYKRTISMDDLPNGVYLIRLTTGSARFTRLVLRQ